MGGSEKGIRRAQTIIDGVGSKLNSHNEKILSAIIPPTPIKSYDDALKTGNC